MRIRTSQKKSHALNLNIYRNLHFRSLSAQKNAFKKIAEKLLQEIPPMGRITLHYDVCPRTKGRLDVMNVGSIVDKYFSDALTETGTIPDDDYDHINFVSFGFGGLAVEEHVLVTITEIEPRKEIAKMRVLLDQDDIQSALDAYLTELGIEGATSVELSATADGEINAEVMFGESEETDNTPEKKKPVARKTTTRRTASKAKPKEDADDTVPDKGGSDSDGKGATDSTATKAAPKKDPFADDEEDDGKDKAESTKGESSKPNPFEESPEDSSKTDNEEATETPSKGKSAVASIFDDDD
jgi:hypothetical protein